MDPISRTSSPPASRPLSVLRLKLIVALWIVIAGSCTLWMDVASFRASTTAAEVASSAPTTWPLPVPRPPDNTLTPQWRLVMAIHPRCPCSRASLNQLEQLLSETDNRITTEIFAVIPTDATADWRNSPILQKAAAIPGVTVTLDPGGTKVAIFGEQTSGACALFNRAGRRVFAGGITDSRGHEGNNTGQETIRRLVMEVPSKTTTLLATTPVFGCPLQDLIHTQVDP